MAQMSNSELSYKLLQWDYYKICCIFEKLKLIRTIKLAQFFEKKKDTSLAKSIYKLASECSLLFKVRSLKTILMDRHFIFCDILYLIFLCLIVFALGMTVY